MDFCSEDDHGGAVHRCIHGIIHLIEDHAKAAGIPVVGGDVMLLNQAFGQVELFTGMPAPRAEMADALSAALGR